MFVKYEVRTEPYKKAVSAGMSDTLPPFPGFSEISIDEVDSRLTDSSSVKTLRYSGYF